MYGAMGDEPPPTFLDRIKSTYKRRSQQMVDATVIYPKGRWGGFAALIFIYALRVLYPGWYIVTYGLAIYLLNLFLGFWPGAGPRP